MYIITDFGSKGNFLQHAGASHWTSSFWFSFLGCGLDISSLKGFFLTLADKIPNAMCLEQGGISSSSGSDVKYSWINITCWLANPWEIKSQQSRSHHFDTFFQTQQNAFGASWRAGAKDHAACNLGRSKKLMAPRKRWKMMFNVYIFLHWFACSLFMSHFSTGKAVFALFFLGASS